MNFLLAKGQQHGYKHMQTNYVHSLERTSTIQSYLCLITRPLEGMK